MRSEKQMLKTIFEVAKKLDIKAIAMNGSKVYSQSQDSFQDFDIVYFVDADQKQRLISNRTWLEDFGKTTIMQVPGDYEPFFLFTFLMLFEDDNRIDLGLCDLKDIAQWQKNDPIAKVLYDPQKILPTDLQTGEELYYQTKPTPTEFAQVCNEFWWVSTYIVKGIVRKEFFYASDYFYNHCFQEFLKVVSYVVAAKYNYQMNLGKNHKYLFDCLSPIEITQIEKVLDFNSLAKITQALFLMQELFDSYAQQFSEATGYSYNQDEAKRVMDYTKRKLS